MANTVRSKCQDTNELAIFFQCRRCDHPQHKLCSQLYFSSEEDVPYEFCNACLDKDSLQELIPHWVGDLVAIDFSTPCTKNRFCVTCLAGFCSCCCPTAHHHDGGRRDIFKIHMGGLRCSYPLVELTEIRAFYNCSGIQLEVGITLENGDVRRLVPLHPIPGIPFMEGRTKRCNYCACVSVSEFRYFCSIGCKFWPWYSEKTKFVKQLLAEDFTKTHNRDTFCIDCRVAFCAAVCQDHVDHRSINIVKKCGRHFVRFEEEKWIRKFNYVMERREGYRLLPLMEGQSGCDCIEICGTMFYCSIHCVVRNQPSQ